jgi:hypothetical protein
MDRFQEGFVTPEASRVGSQVTYREIIGRKRNSALKRKVWRGE